MDRLMSIDDVAIHLGGISKATVYGWLSRGRLRRTKVGRGTMIRESELQKVIHEEAESREPAQSVQTGAR